MATATHPTRLRLPIDGMHCAACAGRVERELNGLSGVEATVNFATEEATVEFDPARVATDELLAAVAAAGYHASLPASTRRGRHRRRHATRSADGWSSPPCSRRPCCCSRWCLRSASRAGSG